MDNTSSNSATIPVLRRGLRRYDIQNKNFILIFIHDLQSWSVSKLWEFLSKRISNCNEITHFFVTIIQFYENLIQIYPV